MTDRKSLSMHSVNRMLCHARESIVAGSVEPSASCALLTFRSDCGLRPFSVFARCGRLRRLRWRGGRDLCFTFRIGGTRRACGLCLGRLRRAFGASGFERRPAFLFLLFQFLLRLVFDSCKLFQAFCNVLRAAHFSAKLQVEELVENLVELRAARD